MAMTEPTERALMILAMLVLVWLVSTVAYVLLARQGAAGRGFGCWERWDDGALPIHGLGVSLLHSVGLGGFP
jgi:hypothetical protein